MLIARPDLRLDSAIDGPPPAPGFGLDARFWFAVAATFGLLCCAVTPTTLWIDEGYSAWVAAHRTFGLAVQTIAAGDVSDRQMPLHYLWLWAWFHSVGSSEFALRAANLPFAALFVIAIASAGRLAFGRRYSWIPFALAPFAWFYLNEARAYFMLLALATCAVSALLVSLYGPRSLGRRAAYVSLGALWFAWLTHMLAGFLFPALLLLCYHAHRRGTLSVSGPRAPLILFAAPFALLGSYYAWTIAADRTGYEYGAPSPAYFLVSVYEFAGFIGLGPPRNDLRSVDWSVFVPYLPVLIGSVAIGVVSVLAGRDSGNRPLASVLLAAFGLSFGCAIAAAYLVHSRFLGRHIAAILPLFLFATMAWMTQRRQWVAIALLWGVSDFRIRALPDYDKDDYRSAVREVIARNRSMPASIAWAADPLTANYYGLALKDADGQNYYEFDYNARVGNADWPAAASGIIAENWRPEQVQALLDAHRGGPICLALSKPDLYDMHRGWRRALETRKARPVAVFRTFEIYVLT